METSEMETNRRIMGVLAHADAEMLDQKFAGLGHVPGWRFLRKPETGLVMLQGRVSGTGAAFNFGEVTVTRAAVSLETGEAGHAYALGRDKRKAEQSAIVHAMWQSGKYQQEIETEVIGPLERFAAEDDERKVKETTPTKVDFFTLVRGED